MKIDENASPRAFAYLRVSTSKKKTSKDIDQMARKARRKFIAENDLSLGQLMDSDWIIKYKEKEEKRLIDRQSLLKQAESPIDVEEDITEDEHGNEFIQTFDSQLNEIRKYADRVDRLTVPDEHIIRDRMSGGEFNRPGLRKLLEGVSDGDIVYIYALDRLGRETVKVIELIEEIGKVGATIVIVSDGRRIHANDNDPMARACYEMTCVWGALDRRMIKKRVKAGIEAARLRPNPPEFGRGDKLKQKTKDKVILLAKNGYSIKEIKDWTGVGKTSIYKIFKEKKFSDSYRDAVKKRKAGEFNLDGGDLSEQDRELFPKAD